MQFKFHENKSTLKKQDNICFRENVMGTVNTCFKTQININTMNL